jgi:hypothetical protein
MIQYLFNKNKNDFDTSLDENAWRSLKFNNFNLVRIVAAIQVMILHSIVH